LSETTKTPNEFPVLLDFGKPGEKIKPPYGFRPINQSQYDYITAEEPNLWFWGNRGGGKSVTARWTCHARALSYPGYRYAILRTSFPELTKNHLIYLRAEMGVIWGKEGKGWNASQYIATYPNGSMGFYMQVETEEQARNALGVEMMEVVFDEAPTFKWDHMMMICSSVRVPTDSGLTPLKRFNGNPTGPCIDDIWRYFIDQDVDPEEARDYNPKEWRSIYIDMKDNSELDVEAYRKQLGVGLPEHLRKAWLDGEKFDSRTLFEVKPTITIKRKHPETEQEIEVKQPYHVIEELPSALDANGQPADILTLPWVRIQGCYDDGFVDPAVMLWAAHVGPQIIIFNERVWQHTNSPDIAKGILEASVILKSDGTPYQLPVGTIYSDPVIAKETTAVQSTMEVMQSVWRCMEHGLVEKRCCNKARALNMEPSTNSRELYASAINRLLQAEIAPNTPKVVFLKPNPNTEAGVNLITRGIVGCNYLLKFLSKMQFDENDPRKMANHKHDHAPVAFAYLAMSYPVTTAPRVESARPVWWDEYFVAGTNIPKKEYKPRRR
jgi:hypothetical protein